ncbi:MAG: PAS domain S-box protein [Phycisphaerales bacterium]
MIHPETSSSGTSPARQRGAGVEAARVPPEIYRVLFDKSPDAIFLLDSRSGRLLECSPAMKAMLGYRLDEAGPASIPEFCASESPALGEQHVAEVLRAGHHEFESRWRRRDGTVIDVEIRAGTLPGPGMGGAGGGAPLSGGQPVIYAIAHDVTDRKRAESVLLREQRLFLGGPVVVFRWRAAPGWPVEYVSANVSQFGYSVDDLVSGRVPYASIVHPDDLARVAIEVAKYTAEGATSFSQEYRLRRADGTYMHLLDHTVVVRDGPGGAGAATHYEGYVIDDTQRRVAERRLALLVRRSPIGIIVWNADTTVREWNPAAATIFGWEEMDARGRRAEFIVPPAVRPLVQSVFEQLMRGTGGERSCNENITRSGQTILCDWYNTPLVDDDGKVIGVASMVEDVTEEVRAQQQLAQREHDLRLITDAVPAIIAHIGADGRYRFVNKAYRAWLGLPREEIIGRTREEIVGPSFEAAIRDKVATVLSGEQVRFENAVTAHGRKVDTEVTFIPQVSEGRVLGYYVLAVDVTERKAAERELAQHRDHLESLVRQRTAELEAQGERLRQASQLAALGTLAAGLGHDMNNMLLPMRCALDSLEHAPGRQDKQHHVAALRRSLEFLGQLSSDLLSLASAPDDAARGEARTNLATWWARDGAMLAGASRGVLLKIDLPARLPDVAIAPEQLTRAVLNLIVNAAEAIGSTGRAGGEVRVWARPETFEGREMMALAVSDDGPGMPDEVQRRAPEPFFTTKKRAFSTGLGLSLVHATMNAAGGVMRVYSPKGQGTTVMLYLPVATPGGRVEGRAREGRARTACVTVADDRLAGFILALLGARNFTAFRGDAGVGPGAADVWITDSGQAKGVARTGSDRKTIVVGEVGPDFDAAGAILVRDPTDVAAMAAALR